MPTILQNTKGVAGSFLKLPQTPLYVPIIQLNYKDTDISTILKTWKIFLNITGLESSIVPDFVFKSLLFSLSFDVDEDVEILRPVYLPVRGMHSEVQIHDFMVGGRFLDGIIDH